MDPPHKSPPPMQPSINSPPPPLQPPQQAPQPQPQESEPKSFDEIEDSQAQSWFQDIFPGKDFPPCLQPQQEIYQDSSKLPQLKEGRKGKPLPWHESPERLIFLQLYPNFAYVLAPLVSPPHSSSKQENVISPPCQQPPPQLENVLAPPSLPHHSTSEPSPVSSGSPPDLLEPTARNNPSVPPSP